MKEQRAFSSQILTLRTTRPLVIAAPSPDPSHKGSMYPRASLAPTCSRTSPAPTCSEFELPRRERTMSKRMRESNRVDEMGMQYVPAVLGFAKRLQFRPWSSRGEKDDFLSSNAGRSSRAFPCSKASRVSSSLRLSLPLSEAKRRGRSQVGNTLSENKMLGRTLKRSLKDPPSFTSAWLLYSCLCLPSLDRLDFKVSAFYLLASIHIGSSRVFQT